MYLIAKVVQICFANAKKYNLDFRGITLAGPNGEGDLTEEQWEDYTAWLKELIVDYLCLLVGLMLKVLKFSDFSCKSIDTNLTRVREVYDSFQASIPKPAEYETFTPKPPVEGVIREGRRSKQDRNKTGLAAPPSEDQPAESEPAPYITQMAKEYTAPPDALFQDEMRIKTRQLEVSSLKGGYQNSGPMKCLEDLLRYMEAHEGRVTRRLVVSLISSLYDPNNVSRGLMVAIVLAKSALHHLYLDPPEQASKLNKGPPKCVLPDWDVQCPKKAQDLLYKAMRAFYLLKDKKTPRTEQIFHTRAGRLLILMSDASVEMGTAMAYVVTYAWLGGKYTAKPQLCWRNTYTCRKDWTSMPEKESHFVFKSLEMLLQLIPALERAGLTFPPEHIAIVTDSITSLIHARSSVARVFTNKLGFLSGKIQALFYAQGMDPSTNMYFYNQTLEPFPADKISKVKPDISDEGILKLDEEIHDVRWMARHPSTWPISRGIVGKPDLAKVGADLKINGEDLVRVQGELMSTTKIGGGVGQEVTRVDTADQTVMSLDVSPPLNPELTQDIEKRQAFFDPLCARYQKILDTPPTGERIAWQAGKSLCGTLGIVLYWVARVRLRIRRRKNGLSNPKNVLTNSKQSPWCGYLMCDHQWKCKHAKYPKETENTPPLDFGGRSRTDTKPHRRIRDNAPLEVLVCGEKGCMVCDRSRKDRYQTATLALQGISDQEEPSWGQDHLLFTHKQTNLLAHFNWNSALKPALVNRALDVVCSSYPELKSKILGWPIERTHWGNAHLLTTTTGRLVRDTSTISGRELGRPYYRVISGTSELAIAITVQVHDNSHHRGPEAAKHLLELTGIKIPDFGGLIKQVISKCRLCELNRIRRANPSRLLKRKRWGPLDIGTISELNNSSASAYWVCDTVGPMQVLCSSRKCHQKPHVAVFVQLYTKRTIMYLIQDLSVRSMYDALVRLTSTEGRVDLLVCDPASTFKAVATDVGPIEARDDDEALEILGKLSKRMGEKVWIRLLLARYSQGKLNKGIRVRVSPTNQSHLQNQAEKMVERVKLLLSPENVFRMKGKASITEGEAETMLHVVAHMVNNLPTHRLSEGCYFSPNDILACSGRLAINAHFPDMFDQSRVTSPKLEDAIALMEELARKVRANLFTFFLPLLRDDEIRLGKTPEGSGENRTIEDLTPGSVVCDYKEIKNSHSIRGSIARVEVLGKGNRWCIISSLNQQRLKAASTELKETITKCRKHEKRGCHTCIRARIEKERSEEEKKKTDATPLDIRVRRCDELFLIHREPLPGEQRARDPSRGPRGKKDSSRGAEGKRYRIPPLEAEVDLSPAGSYLIAATPQELKRYERELLETEDTPSDGQEEPSDQPPQNRALARAQRRLRIQRSPTPEEEQAGRDVPPPKRGGGRRNLRPAPKRREFFQAH